MRALRLGSCAALAVLPLLCLTIAGHAGAVTTIVTPGEQNTYSGENSCDPNCNAALHTNCNKVCDGTHWLHYPELVQQALGAGYAVQNDGDGGSIIGCDPAQTGAAGGSFCKNNTLYMASTSPAPGIAIIGPFGEHDQRALKTNMALNTQPAFEAAYEALVQDYLKLGAKVYIMTPIDSQPWGGTDALPNNEDLVKTIMVPAALAVAAKHSLPVIDSYTAITGTTTLQTMYYKGDGQVTSDAQKKMADLIVAAIMSGSGGSGGAGGGAGTGSGGAGGTAAGGVSGGGAGGVAAGGVSGGGAGGVAAGTGGTSGASVGTAGAATAGTAGALVTAGAAGAIMTPSSSGSSDSSGCTVAAVGSNGWSAGILLGLAGLLGLSRRRQRAQG